jgi:hypothetical protein
VVAGNSRRMVGEAWGWVRVEPLRRCCLRPATPSSARSRPYWRIIEAGSCPASKSSISSFRMAMGLSKPLTELEYEPSRQTPGRLRKVAALSIPECGGPQQAGDRRTDLRCPLPLREELWPRSSDEAFIHAGVFQNYLENTG